ncbi:MAG: ATP synthase F1 subunit delta [Planctomycetaceae bacterium]|nr:ATP synthase F1 subunit delta [Planctomycetaceae bacterium]MBV8314482.1 ATP synthase F1 subunit delta [Planctomycetaceae bacterium]
MSAANGPDVQGTVFDDEAPEVTRSYAEALLGAAEKEGQVEAVLDELDELVRDVLRAHPRFAALLASPALAATGKDRIVVETLEGRALPVVVRFLRVLNRHGRLGSLTAIVRAARATWDRRQNRRPVTVRSAVPLDEGQRAALHDRLGRLLGATPVMNVVVAPELIGGLVIQVGDHVYDASVRNRLAQLRERLIASRLQEIRSHRDQFSQFA